MLRTGISSGLVNAQDWYMLRTCMATSVQLALQFFRNVDPQCKQSDASLM